MNGTAAVVILAAGSGSRFGAAVNKVLLPIEGRPLVAWSVRAALAASAVGLVLVVTRAEEAAEVRAALGALGQDPRVRFTEGGDSRHGSERRALVALAPLIESGEIDVVAIHDAARPWATSELFAEVVSEARIHGGAVPVLPRGDLVTRDGGPVPPGLMTVQTPQAFRAGELLAAYRLAEIEGFDGTDTSASVERYADAHVRVAAIPGNPENRKVTFATDLG